MQARLQWFRVVDDVEYGGSRVMMEEEEGATTMDSDSSAQFVTTMDSRS